MPKKINLTIIDDLKIRNNFDAIKSYVNNEPILTGQMRLIEHVFPAAVSNYKLPHNLQVTPKDIIQLRLTGAGAITYNYLLFDSVNLDITVSGECTVRFLAGTIQTGREVL